MIQNLDEKYAIIFKLKVIDGYSHEEIAKKLDISVGTSKSQLARARKALRRMIEPDTRYLISEGSHG